MFCSTILAVNVVTDHHNERSAGVPGSAFLLRDAKCAGRFQS